MRKKTILGLMSMLMGLSLGVGCSGDDEVDSILWTLLFSDAFTRADTTYNAADNTANLGTNYNAYADTGQISITSNKVVCTTDCTAEYQTALTKATAKLVVKFKATAFSAVDFNGVFLLDAISTGSGCQVAAGYVYDPATSSYKLAIVDKDNPTAPLGTADISLATNTVYSLELIVNKGELTAILKDSSGETLATATGTYSNSTCLIQEPAFSMETAGTVTFDDFEIYTAD